MKRILIGGLGRSGTTIALHALYCHGRIYAVPVETKFLVEEDGFADLLTALTTGFSIASSSVAIDRFTHLMREQVTGSCDSKFHQLADFPSNSFVEYHPAVENFLRLLASRCYFPDSEPLLAATRQFIARLFDAETRRSGKWAWAEKTPSNIWRLPFLRALWPDCIFLHALRDPRDIFLSLMHRGWLPGDFSQALSRFEGYLGRLVEIRRAHRNDPRFVEMRLEDLVANPAATLVALAQSLGLDPFPPAATAALTGTMERYYAQKTPLSVSLRAEDQSRLTEQLLPLLIELGYSPDWQSPPTESPLP